MLSRRGDSSHDYPDSVATTWSLSFERIKQQNAAAADLLRLCAFLAPDAIPEEIVIKGASYLGEHLQDVLEDEGLLDEAIAVLRAYSLIRRDPAEKTLSIHRLVQAVLRDAMSDEETKIWAERTVYAVNTVFPTIDGVKRQPAQQYILHAQSCTKLIDQWNIKRVEAARLLHEAGNYLFMVAEYEQAEPLLKYGLEIREHILGAEHPYIAVSLNSLALLYQTQSKHEQAKPFLIHAMKIVEQAEGPEGFQI